MLFKIINHFAAQQGRGARDARLITTKGPSNGLTNLYTDLKIFGNHIN